MKLKIKSELEDPLENSEIREEYANNISSQDFVEVIMNYEFA